jgi:hypothetical protein
VRIKAIFKITIKDNKSTEFNRGQCDSGEGVRENVHKSRVKYHRLRNNRASLLGILLRTVLQVDVSFKGTLSHKIIISFT